MPVSAEFRAKTLGKGDRNHGGGAGKTPEKGGCKSPALLWVNMGAKYVGLGGREREKEQRVGRREGLLPQIGATYSLLRGRDGALLVWPGLM